MPAKYKVLITGSSGMLGTDLSRELGEDYEVYGMDVRARDPEFMAQKYFKCDITDRTEVLGVLSKISADIVIHAAAWTDVDGCELDENKAYKINSEGTENIAIGCEETGSTLIYLSTDFVFDGHKKTPYKETDEPEPISAYADSKVMGEEAIKRIWPKHFILRTSWLYGANGKNFVDAIIAKAAKEKELKVVDDQIGSPTYTVDLAKAMHSLLNKITCQDQAASSKGQGYGIYHVSNSGSISWYEYAKTILKLTGSDTKVTPISSKELARPAKRPAMSVLDNSKFTELTGYSMRNWKEALKGYIETKKGRDHLC